MRRKSVRPPPKLQQNLFVEGGVRQDTSHANRMVFGKTWMPPNATVLSSGQVQPSQLIVSAVRPGGTCLSSDDESQISRVMSFKGDPASAIRSPQSQHESKRARRTLLSQRQDELS